MTSAVIYTDGGARGNPGPAAIGVVIYDDMEKEILFEVGEYIGNTTNNYAEYSALIRALSEAAKMKIQSVRCKLDSELVVKQLRGEYKIREENLQKLAGDVFKIMNNFKHVDFAHVPREKNKIADKLVNEALDKLK
jgi:ribonuclease HI